ncbi:peptidase inhibitor 16-like [Dendrobates tinctorius]|uniref:peptidase inhibitor 16-like n=1 Tax=Dendrobates tinctorius TaxID=92724 RepID=UPI003CC939B6
MWPRGSRLQGLQYFLLCLVHLITALTDVEKKTMVEKHNFYRSRADPQAADMKALRWDRTLEDLARSYAAKCVWDHNEERGFRGENLFLMTGSSLDVELGMADWHRERDYYNFTTDTCQEGQMCGHYTQNQQIL